MTLQMPGLSGVSGRIEAAPGVLEALDRGLTAAIDVTDWRAAMQSTENDPCRPKSVPLTHGAFALVDEADYERVVNAGPWHVSMNRAGGRLYASTRIDGNRYERMHGFITGWKGVDHINGNGLDNRRSNLRRVSTAENAMNRGPTRANTSGFKGVTRNRGRWRALLGDRNVGTYLTREEAAHAYDQAAFESFGEFAYLNFPDRIAAAIRAVSEQEEHHD